jgi:hypothetical protein
MSNSTCQGGSQFSAKGMSDGKSKGSAYSKGSGKGSYMSRVHRQEVQVLERGCEAAGGFALRGTVLGRGGENFAMIREETGVRIWLAGCGSGREVDSGKDNGPMRIVLTSPQPDALAMAAELAEDLARSVRERLQEFERRGLKGQSDSKGEGKGKDSSSGKGKGKAGVSQYVREEKARIGREIEEASMHLEEAQREENMKRQLFKEQSKAASNLVQVLTPEIQETRRTVTEAFTSGGNSTSETTLKSAQAFWDALDRSRAEGNTSEAQEARRMAHAAQKEALIAAHTSKGLQKEVKQLKSAMATVGLSSGPSGRCCSLFASCSCPFENGRCPRGSHQKPETPTATEVFGKITKAKLRFIQQKWCEAGGRGQLVNAWQVRNPQLEFLFRGAEANFQEVNGNVSDVVDAWHGSREQNIVSIARNGFDPGRRCGQVFGAGEYFAKDPNVSIAYAGGGAFMFLCKILLGKPNIDHTWAGGPQYYVIKQREGRVQVLPIFLVQFKATSSPFHQQLIKELALTRDVEDPGTLAAQQRGGLFACEARRDAGMVTESTRHLWLGWLAPGLRFKDDDGIVDDVSEFLEGFAVEQVVPERNGARIGAFVLLQEPIDRQAFWELSKRKYHGEWTISVDDAQPGNPKCSGKPCPRLCGPSKYCRGWNIRGHAAWNWGCPFAHPEELRPTFEADVGLEIVERGTAKFDEIQTELRRSMPHARIVRIQRSKNAALDRMYDQRRAFLHDKHGFAVEKELWHGTSVDAIPTLLKHGLQPPADSVPSGECPVSGNKGLCTTLCSTECEHCTQAHGWGKCHMYGLGVYLADVAQKSHQYVRKSSGSTYSMLRCRVCLGNPYLIEGNLLSGPAMHDVCWCQDPSEFLESLSEDWSVAKGHDSFYVKGQCGSQKQGLGVYNNEYIVFQPYQILPLYRVDYTI